jgi:radical SAM superfamily enzyme YgiQ (UPF0313 family)
MTTVPTPRFDLLKMERYLFGSVQFSRGCPFQCEFCDIIVTFGRRPRLKTGSQVEAELEALRRRGVRIAFIVDDNLIGNKRAIAELLRVVAAWQHERGYAMSFFTEASIDLAEEPELMRLMVEANIRGVFVGIESPNAASLEETKKYQNLRGERSLAERVHAIQRAGLEVWCGMILGFDHDGPEVFEAQRRFLEEARVAISMIGMLTAIPKTPLHARLAAAGRLDGAEFPEFGTNVIPLGLSRRELTDGYVRLMDDVYAPEAYFARVESLYLGDGLGPSDAQRAYWRRHPLRFARREAWNLAQAAGLFARLMLRVPDPALRREYRRRVARLLRVRRDPETLLYYVIKCALHYHAHTMARQMASGRSAVVNTY